MKISITDQLLGSDLNHRNTQDLVRLLCGSSICAWEESPCVLGGWQTFMPDRLWLERFITDYELDGKGIFGFLSDNEADFGLEHFRRVEYPERCYIIDVVRRRVKRFVVCARSVELEGEMAQSWLPEGLRRADFRKKRPRRIC